MCTKYKVFYYILHIVNLSVWSVEKLYEIVNFRYILWLDIYCVSFCEWRDETPFEGAWPQQEFGVGFGTYISRKEIYWSLVRYYYIFQWSNKRLVCFVYLLWFILNVFKLQPNSENISWQKHAKSVFISFIIFGEFI